MRGRRTFKGAQGGWGGGLRCEKLPRGFVYSALIETIGDLELNTTGSINIAACAASPDIQGLVPPGATRKGMGCSAGKTSLCHVQDPEVGDATQSLLVRKVTMTMVLGSTVTSAVADRVAEPAVPRQLPRWGWSAKDALVARGHCKPELDAAVSLGSPDLHVLALDLSK